MNISKLNYDRRVSTSIEKVGYGHWRVTMSVYGKRFSMVTFNSSAVDDYNDTTSERRMSRGYLALRRELMRTYWQLRK